MPVKELKKATAIVIADTAGRLQARTELMDELAKVHRVIGKALPGAPHEVWLVLDATNGQNAISQAKVFTERVSVSGVILTKLDGTAKGVIISIKDEMKLPSVTLEWESELSIYKSLKHNVSLKPCLQELMRISER